MLFCSRQFLFFFAAVFALYWALPWRRARVWLLLGASFARVLTPLVVTRWAQEPSIGGSYSHALPGCAEARKVLGRPASERDAHRTGRRGLCGEETNEEERDERRSGT